VDPTNNVIDPDAKFALACHPHIEAAFYCGQILRHSPEDVKRVRCRIIFQYGERTMLFYPHLRQPLADKYPHLYELGEAVPKATHTLIVEDPDTCASRIVESLAKFTPFHQPQAAAQSRL
jgi:pimeloyl-ACP methyl ester carboxylesterase